MSLIGFFFRAKCLRTKIEKSRRWNFSFVILASWRPQLCRISISTCRTGVGESQALSVKYFNADSPVGYQVGLLYLTLVGVSFPHASQLDGFDGLIAGELIDGHRFRSLERWSRKWNTRGSHEHRRFFPPRESWKSA